MSIDLEGSACESEAARLLPWFVTARLSAADGERVTRHLEHCGICRADLAEQRSLRTTLKAEGPIEYAPQAGLAKALARIDELTREAPPVAAVEAFAGMTPAWRRPAVARWLIAAVVVQAVGLGVLGAALLARPTGDAARYQTLSAAAPATVDGGPRIRAVFAPSTTLAELGTLFARQRLRVIAGPTEAGVFTLAASDAPLDRARLQARLAELRADARVLFAEPALEGGASPR